METNKLKILAIDDNSDNLIALKAVMADQLPGAVLLTAIDGQQGLQTALAEDPDVILLDIVMPGMDGFTVCRKLKGDGQLNSIPVLFLTALRTDRESRVKALKAGAEGFLSKPFDEFELTAQIQAMAKIKAANRLQQREQHRLARLVAERTRELQQELGERRRVEQEREITLELLRLANTCKTTRELAQAAVTFFQRISGCEAVGLRLREEEDYPYYQVQGFPEEFVQVESQLCARDAAGQLLRDHIGNPVLACMCGNVICGRFDPSKPFFSAQGSFWTNSTTQLLATTSEADRQARTRNRCNGEGYESVALIPLRVGDERLGLLQLNDRQPGLFTAEGITLWERLAGSLAVTLSKLRTDEALRESEEWHRTILQTAMDGYWMVDTQGHLLDVNAAYCRMSGYAEEELLAMRIPDLEAVETGDSVSEHMQQILAKGEERFTTRHRRKDGRVFDVEVSVQYRSGEGSRLVVFLRDITDRKRAEVQITNQLEELQKWQDLMLGREDRVQELKREVNELCRRLGESIRYLSQEDDSWHGEGT